MSDWLIWNVYGLQIWVSIYNTFVCAGFVYGAKEGKRLQLFIDDVNLPTPDEHGVQRCNEVGCHQKISKCMITDMSFFLRISEISNA